MNFAGNLEKCYGQSTQYKLFEQEVNSNKAQISLEKSKKITKLIGGVYWQTFKTQTSFQDGYNGVYGQFEWRYRFQFKHKKQTKKH
jgi:cobalt-zinc-cadmium resistance protein CzcA